MAGSGSVHVWHREVSFQVHEGQFILGVGLPYKKDGGGGGGCPSEILKRTPKRFQDPVLWAWLEFFLNPIR